MNRRKFITSLALSMGYCSASIAELPKITLAPAGDSSLWDNSTERLFSLLGDVIIPETDRPGSLNVGAHTFVVTFIDSVADSERKARFLNGAKAWKQDLYSNEAALKEVAIRSAIHQNLSRNFSKLAGQQNRHRGGIDAIRESAPHGLEDQPLFSFLVDFRKLILCGYFLSEEIGERHLSYLPIPGQYIAKIKASKVDGVWSPPRSTKRI